MREGDWELCKELARFLAALDETGDTLREALDMVGVGGLGGGRSPGGIGLGIQIGNGRLEVPGRIAGAVNGGSGSPSGSENGSSVSTLGPESRGSESDGELASPGAASESGSVTSGARSDG